MFYLPILSENQKNNLGFEFKRRLIISYLVDVLVIFIFFIILLVSFKFVVFAKINMLKKTSELEMMKKTEAEITNKEIVIKDLNKSLLMLNGINVVHFDLSEVLYNLSLLMPANARLYSLQISEETKLLTAQGNVPWREDILTLQSNLEKSEFFSDVEFPLSNFTEKENVDFYFNAKVD